MKRSQTVRRIARVVALVLLIASSPALAAPPHATAAQAPARTRATTTVAQSVTPSRLGLPPVGAVMHHVPLTLLQSLLSTTEGRVLLRGGLDPATVSALEHRYGTTPLPGSDRLRLHVPTTPNIAIQPVRTLRGFANGASPGTAGFQPAPGTRGRAAGPSQSRQLISSNRAAAIARADAAYGALPISFELNRGQSNRRVLFLAHGAGSSLFLTANDAVLSLVGGTRKAAGEHASAADAETVVRLHLVGASAAPRIVGLDRLPGRVNYLIGRDRNHWITNVPTYARVAYDGVYRGIDLVYHGQQGKLEYDYVVAPGANARAIELAVQGAGRLRLDGRGNLDLLGASGQVSQQRPVAYQIIGRARYSVPVRFVLGRDGVARFAVGAYNRRAPLIIDPVLLYSTYLGGSGTSATGIAVGSDGSAYITGYTTAPFTTTTGAQATFTKSCACDDAFVSKINPDGNAFVYTTYVGGTSASDKAFGIAVDGSGQAYIVGVTGSNDFPTSNALHGSAPPSVTLGHNSTAFVSVLNTTGNGLPYSTYLGDYRSSPTASDSAAFAQGNGIALDGSDNVYVTGVYGTYFETPTHAGSGTDPAANCGNNTDFSGAAFITKLNPSLGSNSLLYSACLEAGYSSANAPSYTTGRAIVVDGLGNAYVTGDTGGRFFPITGQNISDFTCPGSVSYCLQGNTPYQPAPNGGDDAFLTEVDPAGSEFVYSSYLGGSGDDRGDAIALDGSNDVYITGYTTSSNDYMTTSGAYQAGSNPSSESAFVVRMNPNSASSGTASLVAGTYLGGTDGVTLGSGIGIDSFGDIYVTGNTTADNFPTRNALAQSSSSGSSLHGVQDAFVAELSASLQNLNFSSYLGGGNGETGAGIAMFHSATDGDSAYVAGTTTSTDFPSFSEHGAVPQSTPGGSFVSKIDMGGTGVLDPAINTVSPASGSVNGGTTVTITGQHFYFPTDSTFQVLFNGSPATNVSVSPDGTVITATTPSYSNINVTTPQAVTVEVVTLVSRLDSTHATSNFTYLPAPNVAASSPSYGPANGGTTVTITGTNFAGATAVLFVNQSDTVTHTAPAYVNGNGTVITTTTPAAAAGIDNVYVQTPGGLSGFNSNAQFTYEGVPAITGLWHADGPITSTATVNISGTSLFPAQAVVTFGGRQATVDLAHSLDTSLVVTPPVGLAPGPVPVTVTTPGGTSAITPAATFTYLPIPAISGLRPNDGPIGGGTQVVITGTGLFTGTDPTSGLSVSFGGQAATAITPSVDGSVITVTSPATGAAVSADVRVTTPGGTSAITPTDQFTYQPGPTITSFNPPGGPLGGGQTIVITGSGFVPGQTSISVNGLPSGPVSVTTGLSGTTVLTTTTPATATAGPATLRVSTPGGSVSANNQYIYYNAPSVGGVSPSVGLPRGGANVTITGTNFTSGATAFFGSQPAVLTQVLSSTEIVASSPVTTGSGLVDVRVVALGGISPITPADQFTYATPGPCPGVPGTPFHAVLDGWSIDATVSPLNGQVPNVTVTPPSGIQVRGGAFQIPCLTLTGGNALPPSIDLSSYIAGLTYHGFSVTTAGAITLDSSGLSIGIFGVNLPSAIVAPGAISTLTASNVLLLSSGDFGSVPSFSSAALSYHGFTVTASGLSFGNDTLGLSDVEFGLPQSLLPSGSAPITLTGSISVGLSGGISGSLSVQNLSLNEDGFTIGAGSITLDNTGLNVNNATFTLPASLTPPNVNPIQLTGQLQITPAFAVTGSLGLKGAGFSVASFSLSGDVTLDSTGLNVANARLTLPSSLTLPGGSPITISGALQITSSFNVFGSLSSGPASLSLDGFTASVQNVVFDSSSGLSVSGVSLALPNLGTGVSNIALTADVHIDKSFHITGSASVSPFTVQDDGFNLAVGGVTLSNDGLAVGSAIVALPAPFAGSQLTGSLHIGSDQDVSGTLTLQSPNFSYAGFSAGADSISLNLSRAAGTGVSGVVQITNARATLPGLTSVAMTGNLTASLTNGSLQISGQLVVSGSSGNPIALAFGAFTVDVGSLTLNANGVTADGKPFSGVEASGVTFTLPSSLSPGGVPLVLTGGLTIGTVSGHFQVDGFIELTNVQVAAYGFTVTVDDIKLGTGGLSIGTATLDMDSVLGQSGLHSLSISGLTILPDFSFSGGVVSINGSSTLTVGLDGASLSLSNFSISSSGLTIAAVTIVLPAILGGHQYTLSNLLITDKGEVSGKLAQSVSFSLGDFSVSASGLTLDSKTGVVVTGVSFSLPILDGPVSIGDLGFDGHTLTVSGEPLPTSFTIPDLKTGAAESPASQKQACDALPAVDPVTGASSQHLYLPLPPINAGGFSITGGGCLTLDTASGGQTTYLVVGQGTVDLAKVGSLAASFEIGSPDTTHPYVFHHATINVQVAGAGIPLDETGLEINGIIGGFGITKSTGGQPIYSVEVGVDMQTDDGGYTFQGNVHLSFATDGNFGIGGSGVFFTLLPVYGGFCVRVTMQPDYVCQDSLSGDPTFATQATGLGLYAVVGSNVDIHINKDITFNLNARAHLWVDGDGPELAASADVGFHVPTSAFYTLIPPCPFDFNGSAEIGKFYYNGGKVAGFKGEFSADICDAFSFDESLFVDDGGGVHLGDVSGYTLIEGQNQDGYLMARLNDGGTQLTRVIAIASPAAVARAALAMTPGLALHTLRLPAPSAAMRGLTLKGHGSVESLTLKGHGVQEASLSAMGHGLGALGGIGRVGRALAVPAAVAVVASAGAPSAPRYANEATVRVLPGQTATMFTLLWQRGAPGYTLTAPDGTVYSPTHVGAGNHVFHTTTGLPAGFIAGEAIYVARPMAGLWHVTIGNLSGNEGYRLEVHGHVPAAALAVTAPAAGQTLVAHPAALLSGTLGGNTDPTASSVSLYYTMAPTVRIKGQTMPNYGGTLITTGVPVAAGKWSYGWDTSALPAGTYYVYAVLDNGTGPLVNAYAGGQVRVMQPARPEAPRAVTALNNGSQLTLMWSPPARAGIVAGYRLRYRTSAMPKGHYYVLDLGESQSYVLNETELGVRYSAEVSDYDLSGHQSDWVAAGTAAQPGGTGQGPAANFTITAGRDSIQAGGLASIPLALRPARGARPSHGPADFVSLSVDPSALPSGVLARPTLGAVDLFAPGTGTAAPRLHVFTSARLRPGAYSITVIARQNVGGVIRARTARGVLIIHAGDPSMVALRVGHAQKRADGLMQAPLLARVSDQSGAAVTDGHTLTFSSLEGTFTASRVEVVRGVARTTLLWVPGTHPIVTADAGSTLANLYVGPAPRGASTNRYFAASGGRAAHAATRHARATPAVGEEIVLSNPLPAQATVRLHLFVQPPHAASAVEQVMTVPLAPQGRVVERLDALTSGYPLIGVEVQSDLPVVSARIVRQAMAHGRTHTLGTMRGMVTPRGVYRFVLARGRTTLDLFNPDGRATRVSVSVSLGVGGRTARLGLVLPPGGSARVETGDLAVSLPPRGAHDPIVATVRADIPIVAEADPVVSPTGHPLHCASVQGARLLVSCTLHYVNP